MVGAAGATGVGAATDREGGTGAGAGTGAATFFVTGAGIRVFAGRLAFVFNEAGTAGAGALLTVNKILLADGKRNTGEDRAGTGAGAAEYSTVEAGTCRIEPNNRLAPEEIPTMNFAAAENMPLIYSYHTPLPLFCCI